MLDTKLKSNKRVCLLIACIITALFAGGFMALYPVFESKADEYCKDGLSSGSFLENLYKSNYVFYKEIAEKVNETIYSYDELYLDIEEEYETGRDVRMTDGGETDLYEGTIGDVYTILDEMRTSLANSLDEWESGAAARVSQQMDYCVIDRGTGELIKNTGKNIEALAGGDDSEKQKLPYIYYVMVTYDNAGNLDHVAVKGKNSDELLKSVQAVMRSRNFNSQFADMYENGNYVQRKEFYGYRGLEGKGKKITCSIQAPKNTTFIYAMTQEQKDAVIRSGMLSTSWDEWYAYYRAGTYNIYLVMMGMLTVIALLLMLNKKYCLHHTRAAKLPLEAAIFLFVMIVGTNLVVDLVNHTNRGYYNSVWKEYLLFLPPESYPILTGVLNFGVLFLLFGGWFYTVHTLGEIPALGIRGFLKERSICVRIIARLGRWIRKLWHGFKDELLHVDLGDDMGNTLHKVVLINFILLGIICSTWFFGWFALIIYSIVLYFLLKKYIKKLQDQYRKLLDATGSIAEGNLNTAFDEDFGVFESYKDELYKIQEGFRKAVDEEVKSQRMKAELITNVSHDLKTPLTAITTYIDLLKEEGVTEEQRKEYIAVLEKKSLRLKRLIEDLFEVSKASSRNVTVNLVEMDICNLMRQVYLEYEDKVEDANLIFRFRMPEEKVVLKLDSDKTYRIFENLYSNIIKYAMPGSRVYVDLEEPDGKVVIGLRNMSAVELRVQPEELTERFVRGDSSRNTEGSGLGLAIARSFTEIQGGKMEIVVDGDLFKIVLTWEK